MILISTHMHIKEIRWSPVSFPHLLDDRTSLLFCFCELLRREASNDEARFDSDGGGCVVVVVLGGVFQFIGLCRSGFLAHRNRHTGSTQYGGLQPDGPEVVVFGQGYQILFRFC